MTHKLYQQDSYISSFSADILERKIINNQPAVLLDKTAFYPTSGGQMNDRGRIDDINVLDVIIEDDNIWHVLEKELTDKNRVECNIDWPRRFDFMQQHTGFHILAQSFLRILSAETVSSHLGEEMSTIDVNIDNISWDAVEKVEKLANSVIWENRPVHIVWADEKDLDNPMLRKVPENHAKPRLIEIENFDLDPCGGTHVSLTGQVGLVKILSFERIRGYLRFNFVAGERAVSTFRKYFNDMQSLCKIMTTGPDEIVDSINKLSVDYKSLFKQNQDLEKTINDFYTKGLLEQAKESSVIYSIIPNKNIDALRKMAGALVKQSSSVFLLGSNDEKAAVVFASARNDLNLKDIFTETMDCINGRGGGSPNFLQGGGTDVDKLDEALINAQKAILDMIN